MFSSYLLHSTDEGNEICNEVLVSPRSYKVQCVIINHYTVTINCFMREVLQEVEVNYMAVNENPDQILNTLITKKYIYKKIQLLLKIKALKELLLETLSV